MIDFSAWTEATGALLPGQQAVFMDVLNLAAEGQTHLVYGADYRNGKPCLVNSVGQMLTTGGGNGIPSTYFSSVVSEFDRLNKKFLSIGINEDGYVSPLAAEILIRNFGELKEMVVEEAPHTNEPVAIYVEPSDQEFMESWLAALSAPAPSEVAATPEGEGDVDVEWARTFVNPVSE